MSTISSRPIIEKLIACDGCYEDDPPVETIIEYKNAFNGEIAWVICYDVRTVANALLSSAVGEPEIIWTRGTGLLRPIGGRKCTTAN